MMSLLVSLAILVGLVAGGWLLLNPKGRYVGSGDARIHYFERGRGTPVILVHGLGITGGLNWIVPGIVRRLARSFHVIAIDCRGHGRSGKPHDQRQYGTEMVGDIVRVMDHFGFERAHVVGYSMGGFITLKMLTMHPERLLSACPCGAGWTPHPEAELAFITECAVSVEQGAGFLPLIRWLQPKGMPPKFFEPWLPDTLMRLINDLNAIAPLLRGMQDLAVTEKELRTNRVPCLAIIGEIDPIRQFADQMAEATAGMEYLVVPKADHLWALWGSLPGERLESFLKRHSPQA